MSDTQTDLQEQAADLEYFAEAIKYFETHDIGDELDTMPEVHFEISPRLRHKRYSLNSELSEMLANIAEQRGVSAETLLNQRVQE